MRFAFLLFPDVTQLDLTGPYEVFARTPNAEVKLVAKSLEPVRSQWGMRFSPDETFSDCGVFDLLVVPGGFGIKNTLNDGDYLRFIDRAAGCARFVVGVCTGALLLGAAGLLRGRRAITHWAYRDLLPRLGAELCNERVVRDGSCVTSGGVSAGIDAALSVVAETYGETERQRIQLAIEYQRGGVSGTLLEEAPSDDVVCEVARQYTPRVAEMSVSVEAAAAALFGSLKEERHLTSDERQRLPNT